MKTPIHVVLTRIPPSPSQAQAGTFARADRGRAAALGAPGRTRGRGKGRYHAAAPKREKSDSMIGLPPSPFLSDIQSSDGGVESRHATPSLEGDFATSARAKPSGDREAAGVAPDPSEAIPEALQRILAEVLSFPPIIELDDLPSFLTAPRAEYLGMIERGAE